MNITGIDYRENREFVLYGKVNPFKKEVVLLERKPKKSTVVVSVPVYLSTFRVYKFPIKDREKIKNLVRGQLKFDIPVPFEEIDYAYTVYGDGRVFCVITKKDIIQKINDKYEDVSVIDSEVFSLIRNFNHIGKKDGKIIHFFEDKTVYLDVRENFPENIRILKEEEVEGFLSDDIYLSGEIPDKFKKHDKVLYFNTDTIYNVAYGNLLRNIYPIGVDFLHKETVNFTSFFLKILTILILIFSFVATSLSVRNYFLQMEIKSVREKEKEIFQKYFSQNSPVYDPLLQAKGLVERAKSSERKVESLLDILEHIAQAKMKSGIEEIYRINVQTDSFSVQGIAPSLKDVEKFKNELSKHYRVTIEESVVTTGGKIRFRLKGER